MYCQNCGSEMDVAARFCPNCGQRSRSSAPPPVQPIIATVAPPPSAAEPPSPDSAEQFVSVGLKDMLFSTAGRLGRAKFLACYFSLLVLYVALVLLVAFSFPHADIDAPRAAAIAFIWPSIAIWVKRLHDMDYSGVYLLIVLIPVVGIAIVIAGFFWSGTKGPNKYGPAPNMCPAVVPQPSVNDWQ